MNFERIKKRGPVSKEYVGQKSAGKGLSRVLFSDQLRIYTFSQSKIYRLLIYRDFFGRRRFEIFFLLEKKSKKILTAVPRLKILFSPNDLNVLCGHHFKSVCDMH